MTEQHPTEPILPPPLPQTEAGKGRGLIIALAIGLGLAVIALAVVITVVVTSSEDEKSDSRSSSSDETSFDFDSGSDEDVDLSDDQWEDVFLQTLHESGHVEFEVLDDPDLIKMGHLTCELLDGGSSMLDLGMIAGDAGIGPEVSGYLTGAAITAFCPEHEDILE